MKLQSTTKIFILFLMFEILSCHNDISSTNNMDSNETDSLSSAITNYSGSYSSEVSSSSFSSEKQKNSSSSTQRQYSSDKKNCVNSNLNEYCQKKSDGFWGQLTHHQSIAAYKNFLITIESSSKDSLLTGELFSIKTKKSLGTISLNFKPYKLPHANVSCFGTNFFNDMDSLPALYVSQWDYRSEKAVLVYRIFQKDNHWNAKLEQTIIPRISKDFIGEGDVDWIVDTDSNYIYALAYYLRGASDQGSDKGNKEIILKFKLPPINDSIVYFQDKDIKDRYETEIWQRSQDKLYSNQMIYVLGGYGHKTPEENYILALNLEKRRIEFKYPLTTNNEPEGITQIGDSIIWDYGMQPTWNIIFP